MDWYSSVIRPLAFRLSPDRAHDLAQLGFRWPLPWKLLGRGARVEDPRLAIDLGGLTLENPIGLAPGFDKNGNLISSLDELGFGYLVIGSITREPRPGNAKPRLVRYPDRLSLGNNLGLPSLGLDEVLHILRSVPRPRARIIASVTGFSAAELLQVAEAVEPHVDAIELGLVCPNTTESQGMAELAIFDEVAEGIAKQRRKPVFVRLPPHHDDIERDQAVAIVDACIKVGIDGVSTNGRRRVVDPRLPKGEGSISGKATFDDALRIVGDVADHAGGRLAIRASGGVFSGEDAARMLRAGATSVEVYSTFVYRGPRTAERLNRELLDVIDADQLPPLDALRTRAEVPRRNQPDLPVGRNGSPSQSPAT